MDLEFYEPAEAGTLKIIFTSDHIAEIARLREVPVHAGQLPRNG
jgi:hypothetical protein